MTDQKVDPNRRLVLASADRVAGHDLAQGTVLHVMPDETGEPGEITAEQAELLLSQGAAIYQDRAVATPVETPEQYATREAKAEVLDDGRYLIRAPWLDESRTVSADQLDGELASVIAEGATKHRQLIEDIGPEAAVAVVTGTDGFEIADAGNGYYAISGPGLAEPEKVRGKANADTRLAELRAAAAQSGGGQDAGSSGSPEGQGTAEAPGTAGLGGPPIGDAAPPLKADEEPAE